MKEHRRRIRWTIALVGLISTVAAAWCLIRATDCTRVETRLGVVPAEGTGAHYERHGRGVSLQVKATQGGVSYWVNGQLGPAYADLPELPSFSPDGQRFGYVAKTRGGKMRAVVDGQPGPEYDWIGERREPNSFSFHPWPVTFSPDSRHFAYTAQKGAEWVVVRDGKEGPAFRAAGPAVLAPIFSPDSTHLAYLAFIPKGLAVVLDDRPGPRCDALSKLDEPVFSPDGRRLAYQAIRIGTSARNMVTSTGEWVSGYQEVLCPSMVVDGKAGPEGRDMSAPAFSPDSKHCAYLVGIRDKNWLVLDGKKTRVCGDLPPNWTLENSTPVFSPDSQRLAYCGGQKGKVSVVVDEQAGPPCDEASGLVFSSDSRHFAYRAAQGDKQFVVADGQIGPSYRFADGPVYSPDAQRLAYVAGDGKGEFAVLNGQPGERYETITGLTFSPDSTHLTYCARRTGKWTLVRDGSPGPWFDYVTYHAPMPDATENMLPPPSAPGSPQSPYQCRLAEGEEAPFSAQTQRLAYVARQGKQWYVVIDGAAGPAYDRIIPNGPYLRADGTVEFLAKRGQELHRVTVAPQWHDRLRHTVKRLFSRQQEAVRAGAPVSRQQRGNLPCGSSSSQH